MNTASSTFCSTIVYVFYNVFYSVLYVSQQTARPAPVARVMWQAGWRF